MRDQRAEVSLSISPDERYESGLQEPREFRVLIAGDFGGRGGGAPPTNDWPRRVDRDDLDVHMARIAPRLHIAVGGAESKDVHLAFTALDDFHPDRLVARLTALARSSEHDSPRAGAVGDPAAASESPPIGRAPADLSRTVSGASLLDDMLADAGIPSVAAPPNQAESAIRTRSDELSAFIDRAVAPHIVRPDAAADARAADQQREMSRVLRSVLHHPSVQALEATWRSLDFLVRRLDTDGELHLFMLDAPRDQLASAIENVARHRDAANPEVWALVIVLHAFPDGEEGADELARVSMAAKALDTPCVAAAPISFAGVDSLAQLSDDEHARTPVPDVYALIRRSQEGRYLGLTFPRVLLRAPYGRDNPCDTIDFEELDTPDRHDDYLWGSGAVVVALLAGEAFSERGWAIGGRVPLDVGGLPYVTYRRGPEIVAKSCAEMIMSERVARELLGRGLMPVAWIRDSDRIRLVELRSVGEPPAPLEAAWARPSTRSGT